MQMRILAAAAAVSLLFAGNAGAVTHVGDIGNVLDFTHPETFSGKVPAAMQPIVGSFGGTGFSITASGKLTFAEMAVGSTCPVSLLACGRDGAGIGDDEITGRSGSSRESITITFDKAIPIGQIILLDLFIGDRGTEQATINGLTFSAVEILGGGRSGTRIIDFNQTVSQLVFSAAELAGDDGANDYAIGGITAAVPLPASILMLLGALASIGVISRRRKAA